MGFDPKLHTFISPKFHKIIKEAIKFFDDTPKQPLPPPEPFPGTGVYGLYYAGEFELYSKIAALNKQKCVQPIYVGKAVPVGWRTARTAGTEDATLSQRLREHAKSISQSSNLKIDDFRCRFTILKDAESTMITIVEAELIRKYKPLWNTIVDGFGNHDPGSGRYNQAKSEWDVLHPGRPWAERLTGESPRLEDIKAKIKQYRP